MSETYLTVPRLPNQPIGPELFLLKIYQSNYALKNIQVWTFILLFIPNVFATTNAKTLGELKSELNALKNKKANQEYEKKRTKNEIESARTNIYNSQNEITQNREKIENAKKEIEELNKDIASTKEIPITIKNSSASVVLFYQYCHKKPKLK